jgi:hypothetical protein
MAKERATREEMIIEHPNREKASSKLTRAIVVVLMLISAGLMIFVQIGGWNVSQSTWFPTAILVAIYLVLAFYIAQWSKGMLPVAAGAAGFVLAFALVAVPSWSNRNAEGFTISTVDPGLLAFLSAMLVPLQILLIVFALRGFQQHWNVEVERMPDGSTRKVPAF